MCQISHLKWGAKWDYPQRETYWALSMHTNAHSPSWSLFFLIQRILPCLLLASWNVWAPAKMFASRTAIHYIASVNYENGSSRFIKWIFDTFKCLYMYPSYGSNISQLLIFLKGQLFVKTCICLIKAWIGSWMMSNILSDVCANIPWPFSLW